MPLDSLLRWPRTGGKRSASCPFRNSIMTGRDQQRAMKFRMKGPTIFSASQPPYPAQARHYKNVMLRKVWGHAPASYWRRMINESFKHFLHRLASNGRIALLAGAIAVGAS